MRILFSLALIFASCFAWAQTGKITKVKGGKAIVDFGSQSVSEGQTVQVGGRSPSSSVDSGGLRARQHGLNYAFQYISLKPDGGTESKSTGLAIEYGYNMGKFEIGPIVSISSTDTGGTKSDTTSFGAFGQFAFVENAPGADMVPYVRGQFQMTNNGNQTTTTGFGGGVLYFPFSEIFAVNMNLLIANSEADVSGTKVKASSTVLSAGWKLYF